MQSTGPITEADKAVSRMNALKTGIYAQGEAVLPTEKIEDLQLLTDEYYDHYHPTDPAQRNLVDTLINSEWLLRRFRRIEADILNRVTQNDAFSDQPTRMGLAHAGNDQVMARLQRRVNATQRNFAQALKLLRELQAEAPKPKQTQPVTPVDQFVPSRHSNIPVAAPLAHPQPLQIVTAGPVSTPVSPQ